MWIQITLLRFQVSHQYRSSRPEVLCRKGVLRNFAKLTGKHLCQGLFFNKVAGLRAATLLKRRLWHRYFPVNFVRFLRTPSYFIEHFWWLLLSIVFTMSLNPRPSENLVFEVWANLNHTIQQKCGDLATWNILIKYSLTRWRKKLKWIVKFQNYFFYKKHVFELQPQCCSILFQKISVDQILKFPSLTHLVCNR